MPEENLLLLLNRTQVSLQAALDSSLEQHAAINLFEYRLLQVLAESLHHKTHGVKQEDLVQQLNVDKSTVSRYLARMEQRGVVRRSVSSYSGRDKQVTITKKGRTALAAAHSHYQSSLSSIFGRLSKYDQKQLQIWLQSILNQLRIH